MGRGKTKRKNMAKKQKEPLAKKKKRVTKAVRTNKNGSNKIKKKKKSSKSRPAALLSSDDEDGMYDVYGGLDADAPSPGMMDLSNGIIGTNTSNGAMMMMMATGDGTSTNDNNNNNSNNLSSNNNNNNNNNTNNNNDPMTERLEDREGNNYFLAHSKSNRSKVTSTRTMESLRIPGDVEARDIVSKLRLKNKKDIGILYQYYLNQFPRWRFRLRNGFNMMFYGLGSKKWLLERFVEYLDDGTVESAGDVIVVNGFSPNLSIREILNTIAKKIVKHTLKGKTNVEQAREISKIVNGTYPSVFGGGYGNNNNNNYNNLNGHASSFNNEGVVDLINGPMSRKKKQRKKYSKRISSGGRRHKNINDNRFPERRLYLIIHNIDGPSLRSPKAQEVLSFLAESRGIHLIASIDHINATFLWDQRTLQRCNFLWNDVTTYESYSVESVYEEPIIGGTGSNAARGAMFVLRSLTPNHRDILRLLAKYQLENPNSKGLDFHEFYTRCRNEMLCNSDQTLRHHLTEFMDHALVLTSRGVDGKEYYSIPLSEDVIRNVILPR